MNIAIICANESDYYHFIKSNREIISLSNNPNNFFYIASSKEDIKHVVKVDVLKETGFAQSNPEYKEIKDILTPLVKKSLMEDPEVNNFLKTKTMVFINFQVEGFHNFPKAAELFPEASFLADRHRHIFHIKCSKLVNHDDRDEEFILWKRKIQSAIFSKYGKVPSNITTVEFGAMSCEMIARWLLEEFELSECEVSEDGENGAKIVLC